MPTATAGLYRRLAPGNAWKIIERSYLLFTASIKSHISRPIGVFWWGSCTACQSEAPYFVGLVGKTHLLTSTVITSLLLPSLLLKERTSPYIDFIAIGYFYVFIMFSGPHIDPVNRPDSLSTRAEKCKLILLLLCEYWPSAERAQTYIIVSPHPPCLPFFQGFFLWTLYSGMSAL